jgi:hypothetical protein
MIFFDEIKDVLIPDEEPPELRLPLIELIIKCKLNETQGQDWGVTLTKKLKLILIGKFKSVKFRNVKFD